MSAFQPFDRIVKADPQQAGSPMKYSWAGNEFSHFSVEVRSANVHFLRLLSRCCGVSVVTALDLYWSNSWSDLMYFIAKYAWWTWWMALWAHPNKYKNNNNTDIQSAKLWLTVDPLRAADCSFVPSGVLDQYLAAGSVAISIWSQGKKTVQCQCEWRKSSLE